MKKKILKNKTLLSEKEVAKLQKSVRKGKGGVLGGISAAYLCSKLAGENLCEAGMPKESFLCEPGTFDHGFAQVCAFELLKRGYSGKYIHNMCCYSPFTSDFTLELELWYLEWVDRTGLIFKAFWSELKRRSAIDKENKKIMERAHKFLCLNIKHLTTGQVYSIIRQALNQMQEYDEPIRWPIYEEPK